VTRATRPLSRGPSSRPRSAGAPLQTRRRPSHPSNRSRCKSITSANYSSDADAACNTSLRHNILSHHWETPIDKLQTMPHTGFVGHLLGCQQRSPEYGGPIHADRVGLIAANDYNNGVKDPCLILLYTPLISHSYVSSFFDLSDLDRDTNVCHVEVPRNILHASGVQSHGHSSRSLVRSTDRPTTHVRPVRPRHHHRPLVFSMNPI